MSTLLLETAPTSFFCSMICIPKSQSTFHLFPSSLTLGILASSKKSWLHRNLLIYLEEESRRNKASCLVYYKIPYWIMLSNVRKWEKVWCAGSNALGLALTTSWPWTTLFSVYSVTSPGHVITETLFIRVYLHSAQDFPVFTNPPQLPSFLKSEYSGCQRSRIFSA